MSACAKAWPCVLRHVGLAQERLGPLEALHRFMNVTPSYPAEADAPAPDNVIVTWLRKRRLFLLMVILPTLVATLYYGLVASDIYISESRFVIKSPDKKKSQVSTLANLVQTTGLSGGQEQANEVLTYVRSRDALLALEKSVRFRDRYTTIRADFLARFPQPWANDSFESLFKY